MWLENLTKWLLIFKREWQIHANNSYIVSYISLLKFVKMSGRHWIHNKESKILGTLSACTISMQTIVRAKY
jgi:hypothetical protein